MDLTQASTSGADPFHKPLVDEHPLVWSLQDVRKGRDTNVSVLICEWPGPEPCVQCARTVLSQRHAQKRWHGH